MATELARPQNTKNRDFSLALTLGLMDYLGNHKTEAARAAIRSAGAHPLFFPPYSPDLNPVEQVFARLKHFLRKDRSRTQDAPRYNLSENRSNFRLKFVWFLPRYC